MGEPRTVAVWLGEMTGRVLGDDAFFAEYGDRRYRIREPFGGEAEAEFRSLGDHRLDRRRMIVMRAEGAVARRHGVRCMCIPFLLFADETVEDRDDVLGPIMAEIMRDAARAQGMS